MLVVAGVVGLELGITTAITEVVAGLVLGVALDVSSMQWLDSLAHFGMLGLMFMAGFEADPCGSATSWVATRARRYLGAAMVVDVLSMLGLALSFGQYVPNQERLSDNEAMGSRRDEGHKGAAPERRTLLQGPMRSGGICGVTYAISSRDQEASSSLKLRGGGLAQETVALRFTRLRRPGASLLYWGSQWGPASTAEDNAHQARRLSTIRSAEAVQRTCQPGPAQAAFARRAPRSPCASERPG